MQSGFIDNIRLELTNILDFWQKKSMDNEHGGFVGRIDHYGTTIPKASKGIILNTRILWTFSAASNFYKDHRYQNECTRAYVYLRDYFRDKEHSGVYWEVDYLGRPTNTRKQVYAQAFAIYALSEYFKFSKKKEALNWAMELFGLIETKALDLKLEGYTEAFNRNWDSIEDMRLSEKDLNAPKTMNTHLHILEAYTTLYEIYPNLQLRLALENLIQLFLEKFANNNQHFSLFFTQGWKLLSSEASYGHDIEAVWLLDHAARTLQDKNLVLQTETLAVSVADTFIKEALDKDNGVFNAIDLKTGKVDSDKHWWPQAEAMVGLIYVGEITGDDRYVSTAISIWDFIQDRIIDHSNGEWFFRVNREGIPYTDENKLGPWKCPYHNSRALIETLRKVDKIKS